MINGQQSLRGAAAGVAAITRLPARPSEIHYRPWYCNLPGFLLTYTQFGATTILIAIFYGFANGNDNAKEESNTLLEVVVEALLAHPGPAILMGDFNHDIETLPALDKLLQAGYSSITTLYQSIYQQTCLRPIKKQQHVTCFFFQVSCQVMWRTYKFAKQQNFQGIVQSLQNFHYPSGASPNRFGRFRNRSWS